jgi:mono/diheme cytochrome c family protein
MRFILIAVALGFGPIQLLAQAPAAVAPAGAVETGKKLWVNRGCFQCHGYVAQGSAITGPRLAQRVPPWAYYLHEIRQPAMQMVPYTAKVLPDQEAADIYAWLKSLPPAAPVSSIPELK